MKRLRAGVIGVGHLGQHHARLYANLPGAMLAGVMDLDPQRAKLIADRYGTAGYDDPDALLRQVDAVSVAVPTSAHHAVVKRCLEAGVHVLVEKPIAATTVEAGELVALAQARKAVLQVGHIERFNPVVGKVRPHIRNPVFIECRRLSPFTGRGADVDVVLDLMIHDLDLVLSWCPGAVEDIRAAGATVFSDKIDMANAWITFSGGCVASLMASRASTTRTRKLRLFQRDACITVDYQARQATIVRRAAPGRHSELATEQIQGGDEEPLRLELQSFLHAIRTGTPPVVSGQDGAAALALAQRVLEAIKGFTQRHSEDKKGIEG